MQLVIIILISLLQYSYLYVASELDASELDDFNTNNFTLGNLSTSCIFGVKSVAIVLYTSNIPEGKFVHVNESCNLFDFSKRVFFMTHGFLANSSNYYFSDLALLLLEKNYTVFSLDWADASCYNDPNIINLLGYPAAVHNTRKIGNYLASLSLSHPQCVKVQYLFVYWTMSELITPERHRAADPILNVIFFISVAMLIFTDMKYVKSVIDICGVPLKNIIFMGHSLGAHISGFAAKNLRQLDDGKNTTRKIPLLIGTDPAAPLFELRTCENRFCETDAERVISLHTSALGIQRSIAHLDFWFNNGLSQPACGDWLIGSVRVNCSHNIVIKYLANMLLDDCVYIGVSIPSRKLPFPRIVPGCFIDRTNFIVMDNKIFDSNYSITGDYCVSVSSKYPYCTKNDFNSQKTAAIDSIL